MMSKQDLPSSVDAIAAAREVMHRHVAALNARDENALAATLHFPHYRLSGGKLKVWDTPASYLADFLARAGDGWARTSWDFHAPVAASADKVHLDVSFTRWRADGSPLGTFRSLWVIACIDGRWAAQLRSSFAS
ncbi:MAG: hypothetical protein AB7O57_23355 [Hyphomicrobiaceae bacterium]